LHHLLKLQIDERRSFATNMNTNHKNTNTMKKAITIFALIILYICGKAQQGEKTIRATDFISINGPFEILSGGCLALIIQECPNTD
jgi:hypothetical protein